jgi:hypothetical protein
MDDDAGAAGSGFLQLSFSRDACFLLRVTFFSPPVLSQCYMGLAINHV